jgi:hypothetical protein
MPARDWTRVRLQFEEALQHRGTGRVAYLDRLSADDPAHASTVRALVEAHEREPASWGRGGMGVVYLATHEDGSFRRQVALKLARWEIATGYLVERFAAERDHVQRPSRVGVVDDRQPLVERHARAAVPPPASRAPGPARAPRAAAA